MTSPDDDKWNYEDEVVHEQPSTAIYTNRYDQVVIKQQADYPDDDPYVRFSIEFLPIVITKLIGYLPPGGAGQVLDLLYGQAEPPPGTLALAPPAPPQNNPAAVRARRYRQNRRDGPVTASRSTVTDAVTPRDGET